MTSSAGRGMASLYAELLEPSQSNTGERESSSTISKAPVVFTAHDIQGSIQDAASHSSDRPASAKKPVSSAALRFQPIPRRQIPAQQKSIKRAAISTFARVLKTDAPVEPRDTVSSSRAAAATRAPVIRSTLEDWATNDNGDDVNGFYTSGLRQRGGRKRRRKNKEKESEISSQSWDDIYDPARPNLYEEYKESEERDSEIREWHDRLYGRRRVFSSDESDDEGERNAQIASSDMTSFDQNDRASLSDRPSQSEPLLQTDSAITIRQDLLDHQSPSATISRAPVLYSLPPAPSDIIFGSQHVEPEADDEGPLDSVIEASAAKSARPGQKGFAERLMSKYGWTKGTGLGANSTGMVHALQVKAAKSKDNKGIGKIMDKNKRRNSQEEGKFGKMSEVVVLHRMVDGLEAEDPAVLMQEIGDECSEKVWDHSERTFALILSNS
ncbi:hypothetical protein ABW21_db0204310 [Orbilia brochopaga]|nr:hypothetical protein ABW21_db0204310 [Drechslerella brochopaga]